MLAWRRGLLEPYYEHGMQSRVKEHMMLEMLSAELEYESLRDQAKTVYTIMAPHYNVKTVDRTVDSALQYFTDLAYRRELKQIQILSKEEQLLKESEQLIKSFKRLKKRGIIDQLLREEQQQLKLEKSGNELES